MRRNGLVIALTLLSTSLFGQDFRATVAGYVTDASGSAIVNAKIRAKTFFRAAYYFPSLTSSAAVTTIAIYILNSGGLLNSALSAIEGVTPNNLA